MDIEQQAGETAPETSPAEVEQDKPRRSTRRRAAENARPDEGDTGTAEEAPAKPKRATRSRRKAEGPAAEEPTKEHTAGAGQSAPSDGPAAPSEEAAPSATAAAPVQQEAPAEVPSRSRRRTSARAAAAKADSQSAAATPAAPDASEPETAQADPGASAPRAKSSVRARRRATVSRSAAGGSAAAQTDPTQTDPTQTAPAEEAAGRTETVVRETAPAAPAALETASAPMAAANQPAAESFSPAQPEAVSAETAAAPEAAASQEHGVDDEEQASGFTGLFSSALSPTSMIFQAPDLSAIVRPEPEPEEEAEEDEDEEAGAGSRRRRRNRGRRARTRTGGEDAESAGDEGDGDSEAAEADGEEVTSRRRRRRRRGEADLELEGGLDDDPPGTITRVRAPRTPSESAGNRVATVKGSTRLEAKKQRRRESRESGRRRHVITEAEFLARRESVDRQMVVRQKEDRIQIAVLEDGVLAEHFVSKTQQDSLIGNVYLGKVQNVLPSMEAAFVDIGRGRNAVLYAGEVNWDAAGLDGAPRRIENALKSGDSVLVQVTKDPVGHKGARLTSQISLPGRYLVYVPGGSMTGISRKLPDVERTRLKKILKDRLPEDAGVIVRTAAEGASEEELTHDINRLRAQWESIQTQAASTKVLAPELLYGEPDLTIKVVRDVFNEDFSKLIVSGEEAWDTIEAYVTYVAPDLLGRLEKYEGDEDIFAQWRIDEQIHKALDRKVFLPSGGSLVIDRTEAMTVIDVNTGKFTGSGGNLEETVTKNNLEAAEEVVRQLRLRDVGGIIVIDFIDMVLESNRDLVLRRLVECLGRDRTKHQVAEVTSLGLVQMTRKRMGTGLLEVFGETCEVCAGRGVITHDEPVERGGARPAVPAAEQQPVRTESGAAGGRKRRRRGGAQNGEVQPQPLPAPAAAPPADDAERKARAEATRAALAAVAAAAHAAHVHDDEVAASRGSGTEAPAPAHEAGPAGAAPAREDARQAEAPEPVVSPVAPAVEHVHTSETPAAASAAAELAPAVLTIGGERIELPHGESVPVPPAPAPALSLDALTHAFDQLTGERHAPAGEEKTGRRRRSRGARSGQGSAEVTRVDAAEGAVGGQTSSAKAAAKSATASSGSGDEPLILGVGVPASEL
ncbi:ribonuclease E/G [Sinomonas sp. R1AF57]|uniref:ribonuclease E/G n=1 Tax=Sinomonas sp. R1AF57 TaxID=2020377 RepID=UPI000B613455|nr:ribonuclease E/G [Sinomonas sp. R1AF57]ASN52128.1 ribonuclease E/G [Sinomonas sp. R1AF57]